MITQALRHITGIGPVRLAKLREAGIASWSDAVRDPDRIPREWRRAVVEESRRCLDALEADDVGYFVDRFAPQDKWRILATFLDRASYFDIETAGLEQSDPITVIACWHRGALHRFVEDENLDEFLELLDDVTLLVSFNGSSFDVPRVLDSFHVPRLPCPHLDMRWILHHRGVTGGLKRIAARAGVERPMDLDDADGALAVRLWDRWRRSGDRSTLDRLIRYCASDVLLLVSLAHRLAGRSESIDEEVWAHLPPASTRPPKDAPTGPLAEAPPVPRSQAGHSFGAASPKVLRARRVPRVG